MSDTENTWVEAKCPTCGTVRLVREAPAAFAHVQGLRQAFDDLALIVADARKIAEAMHCEHEHDDPGKPIGYYLDCVTSGCKRIESCRRCSLLVTLRRGIVVGSEESTTEATIWQLRDQLEQVVSAGQLACDVAADMVNVDDPATRAWHSRNLTNARALLDSLGPDEPTKTPGDSGVAIAREGTTSIIEAVGEGRFA